MFTPNACTCPSNRTAGGGSDRPRDQTAVENHERLALGRTDGIAQLRTLRGEYLHRYGPHIGVAVAQVRQKRLAFQLQHAPPRPDHSAMVSQPSSQERSVWLEVNRRRVRQHSEAPGRTWLISVDTVPIRSSTHC